MKPKRITLPLVLTLLAVVLVACTSGTSVPAERSTPGIDVDPTRTFVRNQLIIGYTVGTRPDGIASRLGGSVSKDWPLIHAALLELPGQIPVAKARALLAGTPGVRYAEPNFVSHNQPVRDGGGLNTTGLGVAAAAAGSLAGAIIDDPQFDRQWQHRQLHSEGAWDQGATGKDIRIGIHDEFMDHRHPDLVDNVLYPGYDGFTDTLIEPTTPHDGVGEHGTWVAGSAAAVGNAIGGRGVAFEASLVPLVISDPSDNTISSSAIVNAALFAVLGPDDVVGGADAAPGIDGYVHIVNMSWGRDSFSQAIKDTTDLMLQSGITLVTSAGNTPTTGIAAPAWYPGLIAVAATTPNGTRTNFSNRGRHLTVAAPGESVWVTATRPCIFETPDGSSCDPNDPEVNYQYVNGTSFSSPLTAGVAALILDASAERDTKGDLIGTTLTPAQVRQILEQTARQPAGYDFDDLGFGIVDASAAVAMALDDTLWPEQGATVEVDVSLASDSSIGLGEVGVSLIPIDPPGTTQYTQTSGTGLFTTSGIALFQEIDAGQYHLVLSGLHWATSGSDVELYDEVIDVLPGAADVIPVSLDVTLFDDPFEANDTTGAATAVEVGNSYRAALYTKLATPDVDYYSFDAVDGDAYRINLESVTGAFDTNLRVLAADGTTVLAENDDNQDQSLDSLVTFTAEATDSVYIEVTEVDGFNSPTSVYEMDVTRFIGDETEPNGSASVDGTTISDLDATDAQAIAVGDALDGAIDPLGDVDVFEVTLAVGDVVVIDTEAETGGSPDTMIGLYDSDGTQVALGDDFAGKQESRLRFEVATAGTYHVVVVSWDNVTTGPYGVSATLEASP